MPTLEVLAEYPPFALQYALSSPTIAINGKLTEAAWGVTRFELAPGDYDVAVAVPSILRSNRGRNVAFVRLAEGDIMRVRYTAPRYSLMPGKIVIDVPPLPTARLR